MASILEKILYLHSDAKCCVWETSNLEEYGGSDNPVALKGVLVDWSSNNEYSCPTQQELDSLDDSMVEQEIHARFEIVRKSNRDNEAKNDLGILSGFRIEKKSNPDLTLTAYLDSLEAEAGNM